MIRVSPPRRINLLASFDQTGTVSKHKVEVEEFVANLKKHAEKDKMEDAAERKEDMDILTKNATSSSEKMFLLSKMCLTLSSHISLSLAKSAQNAKKRWPWNFRPCILSR
eukprot:3522183-Karenia_brevis.AAC.1